MSLNSEVIFRGSWVSAMQCAEKERCVTAPFLNAACIRKNENRSGCLVTGHDFSRADQAARGCRAEARSANGRQAFSGAGTALVVQDGDHPMGSNPCGLGAARQILPIELKTQGLKPSEFHLHEACLKTCPDTKHPTSGFRISGASLQACGAEIRLGVPRGMFACNGTHSRGI